MEACFAAVLLLYLRNYLDWDDDTSTSVYHAFTVMAYLFPLFGAIVADSYWGKYKTIIYLSLVYVLGHIVKTVAAIPYVPTKTAHRYYMVQKIRFALTSLRFSKGAGDWIGPAILLNRLRQGAARVRKHN